MKELHRSMHLRCRSIKNSTDEACQCRILQNSHNMLKQVRHKFKDHVCSVDKCSFLYISLHDYALLSFVAFRLWLYKMPARRGSTLKEFHLCLRAQLILMFLQEVNSNLHLWIEALVWETL